MRLVEKAELDDTVHVDAKFVKIAGRRMFPFAFALAVHAIGIRSGHD